MNYCHGMVKYSLYVKYGYNKQRTLCNINKELHIVVVDNEKRIANKLYTLMMTIAVATQLNFKVRYQRIRSLKQSQRQYKTKLPAGELRCSRNWSEYQQTLVYVPKGPLCVRDKYWNYKKLKKHTKYAVHYQPK